VTVEEAINKRKSIRRYKDEPVTLDEIRKLIEVGHKVPSAGGVHPLAIYSIEDKETKNKLCEVALNQECIRQAPVVLVIAADFVKMSSRYSRGGRGDRYCYMEAGHAGQNISLMAASLGLGCVMIGAFNDISVKEVLGINENPLYLIPVGRI